MAPPRYIMIGGFLGAGKTTAMVRLAVHLGATGVRVGLITNDQSSGLADTRIAERAGFPVHEITGGCFCCRFDSLVAAARHLARETTPDVFIAEPVGSCVDLKATVSYPLRRLYGESFTVAPYSVMVDPVRAARVLGLEPGRPFSSKVQYVYEKQLEEADIIVVNKIDLVPASRLTALESALAARYPRARLFAVSARDGDGLAGWFEAVLGSQDTGESNLPIEYDAYAEGEALLGWFNATVQVSGGEPFDGDAWLLAVVEDIRTALRGRAVEIAHLKATLTPEASSGSLAAVQVTRTDETPTASWHLDGPITAGELILNLRAEGDPDLLKTVALGALAVRRAAGQVTATVAHEEHFRPSRPVPRHRMSGGWPKAE